MEIVDHRRFFDERVVDPLVVDRRRLWPTCGCMRQDVGTSHPRDGARESELALTNALNELLVGSRLD